MSERESPFDALRQKARYVPNGFRDDGGVWHDGPHRGEYETALDGLERLYEAARVIAALHQAGGDEWWVAHARLYQALNDLGEETPYAS